MTVQAPGMQATTQETPRVLKRGQLEFFVFKFFYDKAETQPVMPTDIATHPNFRIFSPSGELLAQGVAVPATGPGFWKAGWVVPKDADLTNIHKRYRLQTIMVDSTLRQFETSFEFDVVETAVPAQKPELQQLLTFVGESLRINFLNTVRPDMLKVKIIARGNDLSPLHVATWTYPVPAIPGPTNLLEVERDNAYVYYTDTPPFPSVGEYTAIWSVRDFPAGQQDIEMQAIEVIGTKTFQLMKSLRMLIDKLQKKLGIVYAYTNEDIIEYLKRGVGTLNQFTPPTSYTVDSLPGPLESLGILASAVWGLTAQRILYAETNFDFSGQTVTLGYNPGADIDSIIDRMNTTVTDQAAKTKSGLIRAGSAAGFIATRPQKYRSGLLYKVGHIQGSQTNNVLAILNGYGIMLE